MDINVDIEIPDHDLREAIDDRLDDFDVTGRIDPDQLESLLQSMGVTFDRELPDFDNFVQASGDALNESALRDLMDSYTPGGCATAQAANRLLDRWLEGVLTGELVEQQNRLDEHIRAVVMLAMQQPVVEKHVEPERYWYFVSNVEGDDAPVTGPFDSRRVLEEWAIYYGRTGNMVCAVGTIDSALPPVLDRIVAANI